MTFGVRRGPRDGRVWREILGDVCGRVDFEVGIRREVRKLIEPLRPELMRRSYVDGWACVESPVCGLIDRSRIRWWDANQVLCICRSVTNRDHIECWKGKAGYCTCRRKQPRNDRASCDGGQRCAI